MLMRSCAGRPLLLLLCFEERKYSAVAGLVHAFDSWQRCVCEQNASHNTQILACFSHQLDGVPFLTGRPPRQRGGRLAPPMRAWLTPPHGRRHKAPPQPCALTTKMQSSAIIKERARRSCVTGTRKGLVQATSDRSLLRTGIPSAPPRAGGGDDRPLFGV